HTVDRCFEILGYPAGYVKRNFILNSRPITNNNTTIDPHSNKASSNTTSNSPVSLSNEQLTRLMNLLNDNEVSTANADMSVNISNLGLTIGHPNETQSLITKIEDLKINNNITLYDVLVVPEYIASLLSVHKLSRDNKLFVGFNASNCYIQDLKANKILGIGRQFNGVYLFDVDNAYHLCDTCNKAKQTREPFPLSDHKSSKIGELVHLDVWGPYKITNRDGFRVSSNNDGTELSPDINQGNDDSEATSMDETNNTHPEGIILNETDFITDFYENSEFNFETEELPAKQSS
ncbi:hypothetical protein Tco_0680642, partial [Tanacetum coccineum]